MRDNSYRSTARLQATLLFCTGFCLLSHSRAFGEELKPEAVYRKALPSVATLVVEKNDGSEAIGSAFMAVKDGLAVTAWHVVKDAKSVLARFAGGEEFEVSGLVDKDEKRDIALVKIKVFGRPMLTLSSSAPEVGSKAYVIGAPKGLEFSISEGLISQVQTISGIKYDQFSCPASPGNSGGPLVSAIGEVTGVVSWQIRDGQNLNFAIPASSVLGLDSTLPTQPWSAVKIDTPMSVGAVADTAAADAVLAEGFLCASDARIAVAGTLELLKKPAYTSKTDFWTGGVKYKWRLATPVYLYQSHKDVNANIEALQRQSMQGARATLRDRLIADLRSFAEGEQLLIETVRTIQDRSGWVPAAQDTFGRAVAALPRGNSVDKIALAEVE